MQTAARSYLITEFCSYQSRKLSHNLDRIILEWWGLGQWCPTFLFFIHQSFQLWNKHRKPYMFPKSITQMFSFCNSHFPKQNCQSKHPILKLSLHFFFNCWAFPLPACLWLSAKWPVMVLTPLLWEAWNAKPLFSVGRSLLPHHPLPPLTRTLLPPTGHLTWATGQKGAVSSVADGQPSSSYSPSTCQRSPWVFLWLIGAFNLSRLDGEGVDTVN